MRAKSYKVYEEVFLDYELPDMSGFDVLRAMPEDKRLPLVLTTHDGRHAVQAFKSTAVDNRIKPNSAMRFDSALRRVHAWQRPFEISCVAPEPSGDPIPSQGSK